MEETTLTRAEIMKRLLEYKASQLYDDLSDEEYFCSMLYDVARVLGLPRENAEALGNVVAFAEEYNALFEAKEADDQPAEAVEVVPAKASDDYVLCDCGHMTYPNLVMNASLGTSCPDCYDRLSD